MSSFDEFCRLAQEAELVPVYRRMAADMETPVSVLARFAQESHLFLLESVEAGERQGRYSFIGIAPRAIFTIEKGRAYLTDDKGKRDVTGANGAFDSLRDLLYAERPAQVPGLPPLAGGAVGYLGYECVRQFEELPESKEDSDAPEAAFMITDQMLMFDNIKHTLTISVSVRPRQYSSLRAAYDEAIARVEALVERLHAPFEACLLNNQKSSIPHFQSNMSREEYCTMVERGKEHIIAGDVIQLVLSQRFSAKSELSPLQVYRALRLVNPSPYTFFLKLDTQILIGSSPETLVKLDHGTATVRPIAGTRPRGRNAAQDRELADELLRDEKERAEHLMLVDLGRNDLGRVAQPGSVQVKEFMTVERYSHVMHLVSTVEALPNCGVDAFDLVRATFPAGTLSGAPKVRAMELIHELEPMARGVYGGAVGYFSYDGNMDLAITIRTVLMEKGILSVQAGAGIVYDSVPENEYQECVNKAAGMMTALKLAANGLEMEN